MTNTAPAPVAEVVDPAVKLADALQSDFAALCAGSQRPRVPESRAESR
ncbi:hypothetical protein [Modestobacter sp. NPDC049651]